MSKDDVIAYALCAGMVIGGCVLFILIVAMILLLYGAVFGAIGAGAYLAFKFLIGLLP